MVDEEVKQAHKDGVTYPKEISAVKPVNENELSLIKTVQEELGTGKDGEALVSADNIGTYLGEDESQIEKIVNLMVTNLIKKGKGVDTFAVPQLLVLTPDTLVVTALFKALRDKY